MQAKGAANAFNQTMDWFKQGWQMFLKDALTWVLMTLIVGVGLVVLNIIPVLGQIVMLVLLPALIGGLLYAAQQSHAGEKVKIAHLVAMLRHPQKRTPFLLLGGVLFGAFVLVAIISAAFVGDSLLRGANSGFFSLGLGGLLFLILVGFVSFVVLYYTSVLLVRDDLSVWDALARCMQAVKTNWAALLLLFLVYSVLAMIASIPFGLGMLVLLPVVIGAVWASADTVFSDRSSVTKPA